MANPITGEPWAATRRTGELKVMFDGPRVDRGYDPMRKQGAIDMGNGGDNSNGSQGTVYEAAMTAAAPSRRRKPSKRCRPTSWRPDTTWSG